jgi:hypothetical protein
MFQLLSSYESTRKTGFASMGVDRCQQDVAPTTPPRICRQFLTALQTAVALSRPYRAGSGASRNANLHKQPRPPPLPRSSRDNGGRMTSLWQERNFGLGRTQGRKRKTREAFTASQALALISRPGRWGVDKAFCIPS